MSFVAVLPSIHQPYTDTCLSSMHPALRARTHVIDNTRHNRGVPASWNQGESGRRPKAGPHGAASDSLQVGSRVDAGEHVHREGDRHQDVPNLQRPASARNATEKARRLTERVAA